MGVVFPAQRIVVVFEVWSPPPPPDFRIFVTGSNKALGKWFTENPLLMEPQGDGIWSVRVTMDLSEVFEYKYACYSIHEGRCVGYEQGTNRYLHVQSKLESEPPSNDPANFRVVIVKDVWRQRTGSQPPPAIAAPPYRQDEDSDSESQAKNAVKVVLERVKKG
eukprot:c19953_g1_i3.p1 GENE.c19953_g1_i3~~c19953_g1_i3.p1  ORF type:complete len:163 (+),score=20.43 c19953_g1_i3:102-590(+)